MQCCGWCHIQVPNRTNSRSRFIAPIYSVHSFQWKLVVPIESRTSTLNESHDDPKSAHIGIQKTIDRVLDKYYWTGLCKDVKSYVKNCETCRMSKHDNIKAPGLMGRFREAHMPWQLISTDLLGLFPRSHRGNTYLLVFSDRLTKHPCIFPLRTATAKNVVKNMESRIFLEYGVPAKSNEVKTLKRIRNY